MEINNYIWKDYRMVKISANLFSLILIALWSMDSTGADQESTLSALYPTVCAGALSFSTLGQLPEGILLKSGNVEITSTDLEKEISSAATESKEQMQKNKLFVLENMASPKLLLQEMQAQKTIGQVNALSGEDVQKKYMEIITKDVKVTDKEVSKFYEENKDMCGGASFRKVKDQLRKYLLEQKKQNMMNEHIKTMGQRSSIIIAAEWAREQATLASDNPVDKARASGIPSIVDFGSTGCRSCAMLAPILEALKIKYAGKANVLFIHVAEQQILSARYGISAIPIQVFFDKDGHEVYRHSGVLSQDEFEKKLHELGASV
jgi:thiol-disulfide isomerase/thioredoxin